MSLHDVTAQVSGPRAIVDTADDLIGDDAAVVVGQAAEDSANH